MSPDPPRARATRHRRFRGDRPVSPYREVMSLVMRLLADGIPPSLLCDLYDPDGMVRALEAEVAESDAARALAELPSRAALEARSLRSA